MIILRFPTALTGSPGSPAIGTPAAPDIMITAAPVQDERLLCISGVARSRTGTAISAQETTNATAG
jgi:hypothetical protein